jgi:hypothetical protein
MITGLPALSIPCGLNPVGGCGIGGASSLAGPLARDTAQGVIGAFTTVLSSGASWLVDHVIQLVNTSTRVDLSSTWFTERARVMAVLLEAVVLPLLIAATIGPILRQDLRRLGRIWGVGLPLALIGGFAGVQFTQIGLSVTDELCGAIAGPGGQLQGHFGGVIASGLTGGAPQLVQILVAILMVVGTVMVWLELVIRAAAVYIAVFFMPLALAGYVWPATAAMTRRVVELLVALILSKFVIVATLTLGLAALEQGSVVDRTVIAGAILLIAGFAPFCLLRLAPIVEVAAIGHLEGLSHRPFRAGGRAATAVVAAPASPVVRLLMAARSGSGSPIRTAPVMPQPVADRQADYPTGPGRDA